MWQFDRHAASGRAAAGVSLVDYFWQLPCVILGLDQRVVAGTGSKMYPPMYGHARRNLAREIEELRIHLNIGSMERPDNRRHGEVTCCARG